MLDYVDITVETAAIPVHDNDYVPAKIGAKQIAKMDDVIYTNQTSRKVNKKMRILDLELKRLNCPLVSVTYDNETVSDSVLCTEASCRLGCVCKSIQCYSGHLLPNHCGQPDCIFECVCGYNKKCAGKTIVLPQGASIYSNSLLRRIDDDAKKNLAKVEKEFAQTVIKADNQLIMVGESTKRRRETRMPKRFRDFVANDLEENDVDVATAILDSISCEEPSMLSFDASKQCSVSLLKLHLPSIIPYCMIHNLYRCRCNDEAHTIDSEADTLKDIPLPEVLPDDEYSETSARTSWLPSKFYVSRNRTQWYKRRLVEIIQRFELELVTHLRENSDEILFRSNSPRSSVMSTINTDTTSAADTTTLTNNATTSTDTPTTMSIKFSGASITSILDGPRRAQPSTNKRVVIPNKRKNQQMMRKQEIELTQNLVMQHTEQIKDDFLQLIKKKNKSKNQYRLMRWDTFAQQFNDELIEVWYANQMNMSQLIITLGKCPSQFYDNIRKLKDVNESAIAQCEIVQCLLERTVPSNKPAQAVSIIVANRKRYILVYGLCERKDAAVENPVESIKTDLSTESDTSSNLLIPPVAPASQVESDNERAKYSMVAIKRSFEPKKLVSTVPINDKGHDDNNIRQILWASLPNVTLNCKWRVIYVNTPFDYLTVNKGKFGIRVVDILRTIKEAQVDRTTIILQCDELKFLHQDFGIYCVHNYADKVFIGPYLLNEEDDLEALNILNDVFVHVPLSTNPKLNGADWFVQASRPIIVPDDDVVFIETPQDTVDLTIDSDGEQIPPVQKPAQKRKIKLVRKYNDISKRLKFSETHINDSSRSVTIVINKTVLDESSRSQNYIVKNKAVLEEPSQSKNSVVINKTVLEEPSQSKNSDSSVDISIEKYMVCDAVNIGFIIANQRQKSTLIDVVCPFTETALTFSNEATALESVARVLEKKIIMVSPITRLKLRMINRFENVGNLPMDKNIFDGHHIVGEFGIKDLQTTTTAELRDLKIPDAEITLIMTKYEELLLRQPIMNMAQLLNISIEDPHQTLDNILNNAIDEIGVLKRISTGLHGKMQQLKEENCKLVQRGRELLDNLAAVDKDVFQKIFTFEETPTIAPDPVVPLIPITSPTILTERRLLKISPSVEETEERVVTNPTEAKSVQLSGPHKKPVILSSVSTLNGGTFILNDNKPITKKIASSLVVSNANTAGQPMLHCRPIGILRKLIPLPPSALPFSILGSNGIPPLIATAAPSSSRSTTSIGSATNGYPLILNGTATPKLPTSTPQRTYKIFPPKKVTSLNTLNMPTKRRNLLKVVTASGVPLTGYIINNAEKNVVAPKKPIILSKITNIRNKSINSQALEQQKSCEEQNVPKIVSEETCNQPVPSVTQQEPEIIHLDVQESDAS